MDEQKPLGHDDRMCKRPQGPVNVDGLEQYLIEPHQLLPNVIIPLSLKMCITNLSLYVEAVNFT